MSYPVLISDKPLKEEYTHLKEISISSEEFSLGRSLKNTVVIPFLSISRNHCVFKRNDENDWFIEDLSAYGIQINGNRVGKGNVKKLSHDDLIILEPSQEFVYKFKNPNLEYETPRKKIKLEENIVSDFIKEKFEASQNFEMNHLNEKLESTKKMQTASVILKNQLQADMGRKIRQLEEDFALQIENLKGEKNEVEKQKALLLEERDAQLASVKEEMEGKISELMNQIQKLNETESELTKENAFLKEKMLKERKEFLAELDRESSSKQELLDKLQARIREQEEIRQREKEELEEKLKIETEKLRLAKEQELKELEELKRKQELQLEEQLNALRKNLEEQTEEAERQRQQAEQQLNEQLERMKKLSDEEKAKHEELIKEREEIQKKLAEAQANAEKTREELTNQVNEREVELAALAAERIETQAQQSSEVISSLQDQLEKVKSQLLQVESEKKSLMEIQSQSALQGEQSTKETALQEVGEVMESELQCSICGELYIAATTLNCSHTFCKYCISMWKKKKNDCPICRAPITSEFKCRVLDSFIEKMVETLSEDMKNKRKEILDSRLELEADLARQISADASRGGGSSPYTSEGEYVSDDSAGGSEGEVYEEYPYYDDYGDDYYDDWPPWYRHRGRPRSSSGSDSESDAESSDSDGSAPAGHAPAAPANAAPNTAAAGANVPSNTAQRPNSSSTGGRRGRGRGRVPGLPGAYYGGYGRCFSCGARGHWAPGCPFR